MSNTTEPTKEQTMQWNYLTDGEWTETEEDVVSALGLTVLDSGAAQGSVSGFDDDGNLLVSVTFCLVDALESAFAVVTRVEDGGAEVVSAWVKP